MESGLDGGAGWRPARAGRGAAHRGEHVGPDVALVGRVGLLRRARARSPTSSSSSGIRSELNMPINLRMMKVMRASYTMIVSPANSWMKNWWRLPYHHPVNETGRQLGLRGAGALVDDDRGVGEDPDEQTTHQAGHTVGVDHAHGVVDIPQGVGWRVGPGEPHDGRCDDADDKRPCTRHVTGARGDRPPGRRSCR